MIKIKQYDIEDPGRNVRESPDGEWVRYEDVEPVIADLVKTLEFILKTAPALGCITGSQARLAIQKAKEAI